MNCKRPNPYEMIHRSALLFALCLFLVLFLIPHDLAHGQEKEENLVHLSEQRDLMVLFTFDSKTVPVTLISPKGKRLSEGDEGVQVSKGDRYLTILVKDAPAGNWKVSYDPGPNTDIEYSVMNETSSIWIEDYQVKKTAEGAELDFICAEESGEQWLSYEIYAVDVSGASDPVLIDQGNARSGEKTTREISLGRLSGGTYQFRLDIFYDDGNGEIFDSQMSDPFEWNNPDAQDAPEGVTVTVDLAGATIVADWSEAGLHSEKYQVILLADGETITQDELGQWDTSDAIVFPKDAKNLEIRLRAMERSLWSAPAVISVDPAEYYLRSDTPDVCSDGFWTLSYKVKGEQTLHIRIGQGEETEEGDYMIHDEGSISFTLKQGNNTVFAETAANETIRLRVATEIYYDTAAPVIRLYDDPDGRTVNEDHIRLIGSVQGAGLLKINGQEIALKDQGAFSAEVPLFFGENTITLSATDPGGNETIRQLLVTSTSHSGPAGSDSGQVENTQAVSGQTPPGIVRFLPLIASALTSLLLILIAFVFFRKTEKKTHSFSLLYLILWDLILLPAEVVLVYYYLKLRSSNHSLSFLRLVEKSAREASTALSREKLLFILMLIGAGICLLSIVVTILAGRLHGKHKKKSTSD